MRLFLLHRKYDHYTSYTQNLKPQTIFCDHTVPFVSDLAENLEDRFSNDVAHLCLRLDV